MTSDWGQGYPVEIPYTAGFYGELAPNHLEVALLFAETKVNLTRSGATYCELGCGYGLTTLILAASNPQMSFVGVDFNPTHIVAANALAESAQIENVRFVEASFDELLEPRFTDLGEFDAIALHGIYSWVAPALRRAIVDFAGAQTQDRWRTLRLLQCRARLDAAGAACSVCSSNMQNAARQNPGQRPRMRCASPSL